jgi:hypothetical protein
MLMLSSVHSIVRGLTQTLMEGLYACTPSRQLLQSLMQKKDDFPISFLRNVVSIGVC